MLSVKQAAAIAQVSMALIYAWCREGLAHLRVGRKGRRGHIRILESDLQLFLDTLRRQTNTPVAPSPPRRKVILRHLVLPS
jgi:predicted site-specific integrase-resolvase